MAGRKKIRYHYYYNGRSITSSEFLRGIGANSSNWKRKCIRNRWGDYSCGLYKACPID